jgi:thiol-disulfide isomerase/thioredoxin/uncharacterized membrane protein YphA (DoxX/SURF4 family)
MKIKAIKIAKETLRLLIGVLFITTAVLKLLSIDEFELYIYSFGIFNYLSVTVLARLVIAFEFLMGMFFILKQFYRQTWRLMQLTLIGFTFFLIYVALFRNDTNCHCFGDFVKLNPLHSILKNVITMALLLFIRKESDYQFRFRKWIIGACFAVAVIVPFVVFPMDALYNKFKSPDDPINIAAFEKLQQDTTLHDFNIEQGNYLVAFYISKCKFCKLSMKKVNTIVEKHNLDIDKIKIFISGSDEGIETFKNEIALLDYQFFNISIYQSLNITSGSFPTFLYIQDSEVVKSINLRGISEEELVNFFLYL